MAEGATSLKDKLGIGFVYAKEDSSYMVNVAGLNTEVDAENTGSVVDGKVNVDTDGDGIGGSLQALIPLVGPALDRSLRLLRL
ncbi:hypothetical protein Tco_1001974 [Tanacetum coccineum]|uniref:Uncharacterized protein n=1 Tax=Tanacetum coccineum TaxID=301880 RepID=A0ABQ5F526_9ASTR